MPLDIERGEPLGDMGIGIVDPVAKWRDTDFYVEAVAIAMESFKQAGALLPINLDGDQILVQKYPSLNRLVFIFCKKIAGVEHFASHTIDFPNSVIAELRAAGRWDRLN